MSNAPTVNNCILSHIWERTGSVIDSRPRGCGFEPHRRHCVESLGKNINPSLVLVQPRKTRPFITERLLMGRNESNQTNKTYHICVNGRTKHRNVQVPQCAQGTIR